MKSPLANTALPVAISKSVFAANNAMQTIAIRLRDENTSSAKSALSIPDNPR